MFTIHLPFCLLGTGPGGLELMVLALAVLILFGPKRLPELARTLGKITSTLRNVSDEFRSHLYSMEDQVRKETLDAEHDFKDAVLDIKPATHLEGNTPSEEKKPEEEPQKDA